MVDELFSVVVVVALEIGTVNGQRKVLGHLPVLVDGVAADRLQRLAKLGQLGVAVKVCAVRQAPSPGKNASNRVRAGLSPLGDALCYDTTAPWTTLDTFWCSR